MFATNNLKVENKNEGSGLTQETTMLNFSMIWFIAKTGIMNSFPHSTYDGRM